MSFREALLAGVIRKPMQPIRTKSASTTERLNNKGIYRSKGIYRGQKAIHYEGWLQTPHPNVDKVRNDRMA